MIPIPDLGLRRGPRPAILEGYLRESGRGPRGLGLPGRQAGQRRGGGSAGLRWRVAYSERASNRAHAEKDNSSMLRTGREM